MLKKGKESEFILTDVTLRLSVLYLILSIAVILVRILEIDNLENILKPLLMPVLILILFKSITTGNNIKSIRFMILALFFSMLGDVFLMPLFDNFILGLFFFLLAHIFYIIVFLNLNTSFYKGLKTNKLYLGVVLLSFVSLISLLINSMLLNNIDTVIIIAVIIYASTITFMVLTTVSLKSNLNTVGSRLIMMGAIIFMVSDAIIALNRFVVEINLSGVLIMSTYTLGQWLITVGFINRHINQNV